MEALGTGRMGAAASTEGIDNSELLNSQASVGNGIKDAVSPGEYIYMFRYLVVKRTVPDFSMAK